MSFDLEDLLRTSGPSTSGPADAGFDYSIFDNYGTDDDPLYGFDLDNLLRTSSSSEEDDLLELFGFGEDERSNADILDFLAGAKENDYQPTFGDRVSGALGSLFGGSSSGVSLGSLIGPLLLSKALGSTGMFDTKKPPVGYQGSIPKLKATREQITDRDDTDRRPGSGGRRYFSDVSYTKEADTLDMAAGGLASLEGGGDLEGATDGQADLVPADIDGVQEARLSHGEYVLPADLVAILGNGNSDAGAKALDEFMSTVRKEATGTPKQQKNIDADKALQILMRG